MSMITSLVEKLRIYALEYQETDVQLAKTMQAASEAIELLSVKAKGTNVEEKVVASRAVKTAAMVMQREGICSRGSSEKCKKAHIDELTCDKCLEGWLLAKARRELKKEGVIG